jgi:hypothetical protein
MRINNSLQVQRHRNWYLFARSYHLTRHSTVSLLLIQGLAASSLASTFYTPKSTSTLPIETPRAPPSSSHSAISDLIGIPFANTRFNAQTPTTLDPNILPLFRIRKGSPRSPRVHANLQHAAGICKGKYTINPARAPLLNVGGRRSRKCLTRLASMRIS